MSNGNAIANRNDDELDDLRSLLDDVPDTWEIVLRRPEAGARRDAWRDAAEEAAGASRTGVAARGDRLRRLPRRPGPRGRGPGRARRTAQRPGSRPTSRTSVS